MYMEVKAHFESKIRLKKTLFFVNQSFLYLKIILCQMTYAAGVRKVSQIIWIAPNQITMSMINLVVYLVVPLAHFFEEKDWGIGIQYKMVRGQNAVKDFWLDLDWKEDYFW